jgi:hypothetical protein
MQRLGPPAPSGQDKGQEIERRLEDETAWDRLSGNQNAQVRIQAKSEK